MLEISFYLTMILFLTVCVFMILLVLIQKGRGGGLASAFGGAGGNTAFGSKTGDVLTWATSVLFGVFLVLAVALNLLATARHNARVGIVAAPAPVTTNAPAGANATNTSSLPQPPSRPEPGIPADADRADRNTVVPLQQPGALTGAPAAAAPTTAPATQPGANP
jgi:preprotein translocase subunit SecG